MRLHTVGRHVLIALTLAAASAAISGQPPPAASRAAAGPAARQRFLEMFARSYFPGRTGQLLIVPREGHIITRPEADVAYMHGSPWPYDVAIPIMFAGPAVKPGVFTTPAAQQDVAPTLAAALGVRMPPTATGRVLPVLKTGFERPRVVFLLVLDGMRRDYFDRYRREMPALSALRKRGAWFSRAEIDIMPSNTGVGHSTIATGAPPGVHGLTGNNIYDHVHRRRMEFYTGLNPQVLMALTLADVWQLASSGRAVVLAQGSVNRAATPLAGHGACQPNGTPIVLAGYDETTGTWQSNADCFRLPEYSKDHKASALWASTSEWLGNKVDSPSAIRRSALFPSFEADAMVAMIEREPLGADDVPDMILLNYKAADYVGHRYGPDSNELRVTLAAMDRNLTRIMTALEARVGRNWLMAVTADHGMPSASAARRHFAPDVVDLLHKKFDPEGKLVAAYESENAQMFIDEDRLAQLKLTAGDLARYLESQPFMFAVYTQDEVRRAAARAPALANR